MPEPQNIWMILTDTGNILSEYKNWGDLQMILKITLYTWFVYYISWTKYKYKSQLFLKQTVYGKAYLGLAQKITPIVSFL